MSLDLFAIGPPAQGLFHPGRGAPDRETPGEGLPAEGEASAPSAAPDLRVPFSPHAEAAQALERLEHQRRILSPLLGSPARAALGSHVDLKA